MLFGTEARFVVLTSGILVGILVSVLLTRTVKNLALRFNLVDKPNARTIHRDPVPRVGGIAIVGGFFAALGYFYLIELLFPAMDALIRFPSPVLLAGALIMALTGLVDDLSGYHPGQKLFTQACVAIMVILEGHRFGFDFLPFEESSLISEMILIPVTFLWIVGVINAVNLLDGMDGLAGGVAVIIITSLTAAIAVNGAGPDFVFFGAFVGAIFGFLVYNFHPAKIFMGDTGSLFIGFVLATYALPAMSAPVTNLSFLIPVFALGLPLLDTAICFLRRSLEGRSPFSPDKDHIHHRIARMTGLSHRGTVLTLYGLSAVFGLTAVFLAAGSQPLGAMALAVCAAVIFLVLLRLDYLSPVTNLNRRIGVAWRFSRHSAADAVRGKPTARLRENLERAREPDEKD